HLGSESGYIVSAVCFVNLLAEISQTHTLVTRMLLAKVRQNPPHRMIAIVVVLELLQCCQQGVPAAFGNADGEHDKERVQAGLFDDDPVLGQVFGHQCRWYARVCECPRNIEARGDDSRLDGVEHIEARRQWTKAMPFSVGLEHPVVTVSDAVRCQTRRSPHLEPPIVRAELGLNRTHAAAKVHGYADA